MRARIRRRWLVVLLVLAVGGGGLVVIALGHRTSGPSVGSGDGLPGPPTHVVATPSPIQTAVTVRWQQPQGTPADWFEIQAWRSGTQVGRQFCFAPCGSITLSGLDPPGPGWVFMVLAGKAATPDPAPGVSGPVTVASGCATADVCVGVDATVDDGPAELRAQGFLHALGGAENPLISALHPKWWRVQVVGGAGSLSAASRYGAAVTVVISDAWKQAHLTADDGAKTPWSDWPAYQSFVTAYVRAVEGTGIRVQYWDVQNEPDGGGYYDAAGLRSATTANLLEQFLVAYRGVKAADPDARIVGPSLAIFQDLPKVFPSFSIDLTTFLNFCVTHGIKPGAVSWHEITDDLLPEDFTESPEAIVEHVAAVRSLLAARPQLGSPAIIINEYGSEENHSVPGWQVGYITALEQSDVDEANHTCWPDTAGGNTDCFGSALDQLLTPDGTGTLAPYWVDEFYGLMTGTRVAVATSDADLTGFAARSADGIVRILVGRHQSCTPAVNPFCSEALTATRGPERVALSVRLPGAPRLVVVTVSRIPDQSGVVRPEVISAGTVTTSAATVSVPMPAVADGEAYTVTISPAG